MSVRSAASGSAPPHVVHGVLSLDVGGLERVVLDLSRVGAAVGRATIVCVDRPGILAAAAQKQGVEVVSLDAPPDRRTAVTAAARTLFAKLKPDVLHTHQLGALLALGPAAGSIPVLHTEHGNVFARAAGAVERLRLRLLWRRAAKYVDRVCGVSPEIVAALGRWRTVPRRKLELVANGVDVAAFANGNPAAAGLPAGGPVLGSVGRLNEVKRFDLLLRAAAELRKSHPTLRVLLVGDGPERANLERLAGELGLDAHFAGFRTNTADYLAAMDVFALSSRSEGFPVAVLEAWASGKPVVCTAVGGVPAVVADGRTGLLVPPNDPSALAGAIGQLLREPTLATSLGAAGRATAAADYSLDRVAADYARRYAGLSAGGREPGFQPRRGGSQ